LYTTNVHALKSACANIGAGRVSKAAYALELAAIKEDMGFIDKNNDPFLNELEILLVNIGEAMKTHGHSNNSGGETIDKEEFIKLLTQLKTALINFDIDIINRNVDTLSRLALDNDVKETVKGISKYILMGDYTEAAALIESLVGE